MFIIFIFYIPSNCISSTACEQLVSLLITGFFSKLVNDSNCLVMLFSILLYILIILIMMSRIYLGAHFASDVFAGMSLSIAYLIFTVDLLERRKLI